RRHAPTLQLDDMAQADRKASARGFRDLPHPPTTPLAAPAERVTKTTYPGAPGECMRGACGTPCRILRAATSAVTSVGTAAGRPRPRVSATRAQRKGPVMAEKRPTIP